MKIKYLGKSGSREIRECNHCKLQFETLSIKVRQGGELFCSIECYNNSRKVTEGKKKENHINERS